MRDFFVFFLIICFSYFVVVVVVVLVLIFSRTSTPIHKTKTWRNYFIDRSDAWEIATFKNRFQYQVEYFSAKEFTYLKFGIFRYLAAFGKKLFKITVFSTFCEQILSHMR